MVFRKWRAAFQENIYGVAEMFVIKNVAPDYIQQIGRAHV